MKKSVKIIFLLFVFSLVHAGPAQNLSAVDKTSYTNKEVDFKVSMRKILSDSLTWQRIYVLETLANSMEADKALGRLTQSENDLSNAFKPYVGDSTSAQLNDLLKQYLQVLADYISTAKSGGDKTYVIGKIHDNADSFADLLSRANMSWQKSDLSNMFKRYYDLLDAEIDSQINKIGALDTTAVDAAFDQAMTVADTLSSGVMQQYPGSFW